MTTLGCLGHLAAIAALTMAIDRFTGLTVQPEFRPWAALVAAVPLVLGASNLWHLLRGYGRGAASRGSLLARARTGEPPDDGGPMVATGRARPHSGVPLRAPFSGIECVAYDYRIYELVWPPGAQRRRRNVVLHWWGMASQPFLVDTERRAVRVAAMPKLLDAPLTDKTDEVTTRMRQYVRTTTFEDKAEIGKIGSAVTMLGEMVSAQGAGVRHDWRRAGTTADPATLILEEHTLPVGVEISVAGPWSPKDQAIVPEGSLGGDTVTAITGGPQQLGAHTSAIPHSAMSVAAFGVALLVLGAAVVWLSAHGYLARW